MREVSSSFLKSKYNLHRSPEVERMAKRTEVKTGTPIAEDSEARIQNYLDYLNEIVHLDDAQERHDKLEAIRDKLCDQFIIKPEDIPESYFVTQHRLLRERGLGGKELTSEMRATFTNAVVGDQKRSFDAWFDYLADPGTTYPDWFKYFAFREVLRIGSYDFQTNKYSGRNRNTVASFPELNQEALARVLDRVQADPNPPAVKFAPLYAEEVRKLTPFDEEQLKETRGEWREFPKGSDPKAVAGSLAGYSTGLCIAGQETAKRYLKNGDLLIYFSLNANGESVIPRAAIHRVDGATREVRGVGKQQNLDRYIGSVVKDKLHTFPDGAVYAKKSADTQRLTDLEERMKQGLAFTKDELVFLYELSDPIQGFGFDKNSRIGELRQKRQEAGLLEQDQVIIFECEPWQIARSQEDLVRNAIAGIETRAYIGPLFKDIFKIFGHIEDIYSSFPEGRTIRAPIQIGGKSKEALKYEIQQKNFKGSEETKSVMDSKEFMVTKKPETIDTVRLKVRDLGLSKPFPTFNDIFARAEQLGLELCPAEVGPHYRLAYTDQPKDEYVYIGMKQISTSDGIPHIFELLRVGDKLYLSAVDRGRRAMDTEYEFVFRFRK